ncbi:unnamed protein product [Agarophyton chilense]
MREEGGFAEMENNRDAEVLKKLRFQNYVPRTEDLKKYCEETEEPDAMLQQVLDEQQALIRSSNRKFMDPTLDLDNIVPRKVNWDMKRSLAPKLQRLEQRTKRALVEILQKKQTEHGRLLSQPDDMRSLSSDDG